ncbi:MAG: type II toxin-antitoxin system VapC family toxin [Spirochaetaceae bacterium]|nr:MAG: type II toxin-antitoxin system VapC family toxin [Spirochaetaceae bacterium]
MILADTSVWLDHFRNPNSPFSTALDSGLIATHPFVIGELACGNLSGRAGVLRDLANLPVVDRASDREVMTLIETHSLMGRGVGLIDMHLLASSLITPDTKLWTHDKRLNHIADELGVSYEGNTVRRRTDSE